LGIPYRSKSAKVVLGGGTDRQVREIADSVC
jgi:hypothetical protein